MCQRTQTHTASTARKESYRPPAQPAIKTTERPSQVLEDLRAPKSPQANPRKHNPPAPRNRPEVKEAVNIPATNIPASAKPAANIKDVVKAVSLKGISPALREFLEETKKREKDFVGNTPEMKKSRQDWQATVLYELARMIKPDATIQMNDIRGKEKDQLSRSLAAILKTAITRDAKAPYIARQQWQAAAYLPDFIRIVGN
jgi:hypothetical protein